MKSTLILFTALLLAPLAALRADEPVSLSADHAAVVNHQRRIFSNTIRRRTFSAKAGSVRTWMR